jgi:hypothetical protein
VNKIVQEATLYYKTLPSSYRVLVHATIIVVVLNLAVKVGETIGRAFYYFTH